MVPTRPESAWPSAPYAALLGPAVGAAWVGWGVALPAGVVCFGLALLVAVGMGLLSVAGLVAPSVGAVLGTTALALGCGLGGVLGVFTAFDATWEMPV